MCLNSKQIKLLINFFPILSNICVMGITNKTLGVASRLVCCGLIWPRLWLLQNKPNGSVIGEKALISSYSLLRYDKLGKLSAASRSPGLR